ncbi:hypothetical protein G5I_02532 [Acromyrmex echinatior]|uniref:Uncharacterized protein n=1 Tax=Acromyrmex echinatior TaxID=103372 RepID=F4WAJ4_ACREC|nr:hypothetical protein G5I_02532 [Acromyrmex echinatior]
MIRVWENLVRIGDIHPSCSDIPPMRRQLKSLASIHVQFASIHAQRDLDQPIGYFKRYNPDLMYDAGSPSSIRNDNLRKVFYTSVTARISIREQAGSRAGELHDTAACKVQGVSKRYHECAGFPYRFTPESASLRGTVVEENGVGQPLRKDWILSLNCKAAFSKFNARSEGSRSPFPEVVADYPTSMSTSTDDATAVRTPMSFPLRSFRRSDEKRGWKFNPECQLSRRIGYRLGEQRRGREGCARRGNETDPAFSAALLKADRAESVMGFSCGNEKRGWRNELMDWHVPRKIAAPPDDSNEGANELTPDRSCTADGGTESNSSNSSSGNDKGNGETTVTEAEAVTPDDCNGEGGVLCRKAEVHISGRMLPRWDVEMTRVAYPGRTLAAPQRERTTSGRAKVADRKRDFVVPMGTDCFARWDYERITRGRRLAMNDVQDGHENSKDCKGETEGCQWHVLDELCSDWSVDLDEPTNQAVNGNEAKPKRMMVL